MYIAVCDDKPQELKSLLELLDKWQKEHDVTLRCKVFDNADSLLSAAKKEKFTLYLLDVMMPGTDGMLAAKEIRCFDEAADIVFITSAPDFAYESYGVRALGYILKPIKAESLFPIIDKLYLREQRPADGITLKAGTKLFRVPFSQLSFVEVSGKHLYFNLTGGQVREVVGSLVEYEDILLSRPEFMRVHRSYIVNMMQVEELSSAGIITFSGKNLPVSRLLYPQLQKDYMKLLFSQRDD